MTRKKVFAAVLAALIMLAALPTGALAARAVKATTMRLVLAEGDVEVREESGRKLTHSEGMQLYSGYEVETGQQSAAYLSLDDKSAVMLDAFSMLKLKDSGKKLELQLLEGDLLTNVSEKLLGGESFNISTSTMTTGIRGTLVLVRVRNGETTVTVLEGRVEITLHNEGGRVVIVEADHYVCDADNQVLPLNEEDLPAYVVRILREDRELLDRVSPEVQDYVLRMGEAELEEMEEQEAGEYYEIYVQPEEGIDTDGGAIVDQVFRNDGIPGVPAGRPAVPPALPGDPVVTALDAEYDGTAHPVVTVSMAGALGYTVEYSLDGGLSWTETCPTVTTVADCEGLEVTVRLSREGEDSTEAVYYPVLNPAPRSFTVTVADYYLGVPVLPIYEGELYDTDSGYSLTENYEASDGNGGWTAIQGEPDEVGHFRLTASVVSDNYEGAEAAAEFDVMSPDFSVELEVLNGVYDGMAHEVVTITGGTEAGDIIEYSVDGGVTWTETCPTVTTVPECEDFIVSLRVSREGCNPFEASFMPSLLKAARTVTVRMGDYAANSPQVSYVLEGDYYPDDSGYSVTELYEVSDGQGGWTALNGQPTAVGDYRVTVSISSDNYNDTSGSAESTVYANTFTVTVAALNGTYSGQPQPVLTVTDGLEAGDLVEYSVDGGVTWTETCPTVTNVADCRNLKASVRVSRTGYDAYEETVVPNLDPAVLQNVTVSMPDYYPDVPSELFVDADTLKGTDALTFTPSYEASDGQGGWVALDEQPTTPGDYRVTVDITSDNYQSASGSAEFRVLKPSAITELALTDIAFDDQTVTLSGTVSALWEQGDDGLTAPESLLVTLELLRSGDNATEFVEVSLDPDPQIAGAYTGVIEAQPDLPGVIWVSASACEDNNAVTYEVPEHQAASYTTAVYLLEVADEAAGQSFFTDWAGLSDALQLSQTPQFIGERVNLWVLRNETGTPADGYTELGGDLEIAGALTASTSVNLVIPAGTTVANSGSVDIEDGAAMTVGGTLNNTGIVTSQQLITVESGAVVYSSEGGEIRLTGASGDPSVMNVETGGTLTMDSGSVLVLAPSTTSTLQGVVNNSGVINLNNDVTDYGGGGVIELNGGSITNSGIMTFQPGTNLFTIFDTAYPVTLTNEATGLIEIYSASVSLDSGTLTNSGEINVMSGSYLTLGSLDGDTSAAELENRTGGSITVGADSTLGLFIGEGSNAGTITVEGADVDGADSVGGFLRVGEGYTLTNTGTIDKQAAAAGDSASMEIYGTVYSSGTINSVGYVSVDGTLYVEDGGILNLGWGEFSLYGTLLNDGTLTMEGTDGQLSVMNISGYEDAALFENGGVADLVAYVQLSSTGGDMMVDNTVSNTMGASFTVGETCTLELNDACSLDVQVGSSLVNNGSIICETIIVTDVSVITNNGTINGFRGTEWSQI